MRNLAELKQGVYELGKLVDSLGESLDLPKIEQEIATLSDEQNQEGFWEDQSKAKAVSSRLAALDLGWAKTSSMLPQSCTIPPSRTATREHIS